MTLGICSNLILMNHHATFFFSLTGQIKWIYMGSDTPTHVPKAPHYILISWAKATVCRVWVFSPLKPCHEMLVVLCYERVWRVNKTRCPRWHGHINTGHSQPDIASWFNTNSDFMPIIAFAVSEQQQHIWQAELCWKNTTMEPRIKLALTKQKPAFFHQKTACAIPLSKSRLSQSQIR